MTPPVAPDGFADFLKAEYAHVAASLLQNEEDGEKRVSTFIGIATAVGGALGFLLGKGAEVVPFVGPRSLTAVALIALLALGYVTMLRVITRNKASDDYKEGLRKIRRWFVAVDPEGLAAYLPFDLARAKRHDSLPAFRFGTGGWLEFVILVNALIAGALVADLATLGVDRYEEWGLKPSLVAGALGFVAVVIARWRLIRSANRHRENVESRAARAAP